jgi:hypothetical protein
MSRSKRLLLLAFVCLAAPLTAPASDKPISVGDFGLIDHRGTQWTLSRLGDDKGIVIFTQANSCAQNIDLLPKYFVTNLLDECTDPPRAFDLLGGLFTAMNTPGRV